MKKLSLERITHELISHYSTSVKLLIIVVSALAAVIAHAEDGYSLAVVKFNTDKVYIYTAEGDEANPQSRKKEDFSDHFQSLTIAGTPRRGLPVLGVNSAEGLLAVKLPGSDQLLWIEAIAVEIYPGNQLECPESVMAQSKEIDQGVTIGFGDHCIKK